MHRSAAPRPRWWSIVHVGASAALAVGTFLPWLYSGERAMSIYDLRAAARTLELLDDGRILHPIALVPLLAALGVLARWAGRTRLAMVLTLGAAGYTAGGAVLVRSSPFRAGSGTTVVLVAAGALLIAAVGELLWARRADAGEVDTRGVGGLQQQHGEIPRRRPHGAPR